MKEEKKSEKQKVTCAVPGCGRKEHILVLHVQSQHKDLGDDPVLAYYDAYPDAPLWSAYGLEKMRTHGTTAAVRAVPRTRAAVDARVLFPDFAPRMGKKTMDGKVEVFEPRDPRAPEVNANYVFPIAATLDLIKILEKPKRNRPYIQGPSGAGKTDLARNLAAKLGAGLSVWNCDSAQTRADIIGRWTVKNGEMQWVDGIVPRAMRAGVWLLVNEIDTLNPHTLNILKPVLEDPSTLLILENGAEMVEAHPDFRIIATANTWARGDVTGMFVNTMIQSAADSRRWCGFIRVDYLDEADEVAILERYFGADLEPEERKHFVQVANKIRDAFKAGRISKTISPAEVINWAENFLVCGQGAHHSAYLSFLTACEPAVQITIHEMVTASFGEEAGRVTPGGSP